MDLNALLESTAGLVSDAKELHFREVLAGLDATQREGIWQETQTRLDELEDQDNQLVGDLHLVLQALREIHH